MNENGDRKAIDGVKNVVAESIGSLRVQRKWFSQAVSGIRDLPQTGKVESTSV